MSFSLRPYQAAAVDAGLAWDGAMAVVCDPCLAQWTRVGLPIEVSLRFACRGYPGSDGRVPIGTLTGTHDHDFSRHPPEEWP